MRTPFMKKFNVNVDKKRGIYFKCSCIRYVPTRAKILITMK